jgi:hypothetical protein
VRADGESFLQRWRNRSPLPLAALRALMEHGLGRVGVNEKPAGLGRAHPAVPGKFDVVVQLSPKALRFVKRKGSFSQQERLA